MPSRKKPTGDIRPCTHMHANMQARMHTWLDLEVEERELGVQCHPQFHSASEISLALHETLPQKTTINKINVARGCA